MPESEQRNAVIRLIDAFPEVLRVLLTALETPFPLGARVRSMPTNASVQDVPAHTTLGAAVFEVDDAWAVYVVYDYERKRSRGNIFRWLRHFAEALERANPDRPETGNGLCPVKMVVVTPEEETIRWNNREYDKLARAYQEAGVKFAFRPAFVGPQKLPEITDLAAARASPALAALTAVVHPQSFAAAELALRSSQASQELSPQQRTVIYEVLSHCIEAKHFKKLLH